MLSSAPVPQRTEIDLTNYHTYYRNMQRRGVQNAFANPFSYQSRALPQANPPPRLPNLTPRRPQSTSSPERASNLNSSSTSIPRPSEPSEVIEIDD